jgi:hypothetical protein
VGPQGPAGPQGAHGDPGTFNLTQDRVAFPQLGVFGSATATRISTFMGQPKNAVVVLAVEEMKPPVSSGDSSLNVALTTHLAGNKFRIAATNLSAKPIENLVVRWSLITA